MNSDMSKICSNYSFMHYNTLKTIPKLIQRIIQRIIRKKKRITFPPGISTCSGKHIKALLLTLTPVGV